MFITRPSMYSGKENTRDIPCTQAQLDRYYGGTYEYIKDVFPDISAEDREFIKTGITPEEWDLLFPSEEDEEDGYPCDADGNYL